MTVEMLVLEHVTRSGVHDRRIEWHSFIILTHEGMLRLKSSARFARRMALLTPPFMPKGSYSPSPSSSPVVSHIIDPLIPFWISPIGIVPLCECG